MTTASMLQFTGAQLAATHNRFFFFDFIAADEIRGSKTAAEGDDWEQ
jgi:hypothetical protein